MLLNSKREYDRYKTVLKKIDEITERLRCRETKKDERYRLLVERDLLLSEKLRLVSRQYNRLAAQNADDARYRRLAVESARRSNAYRQLADVGRQRIRLRKRLGNQSLREDERLRLQSDIARLSLVEYRLCDDLNPEGYNHGKIAKIRNRVAVIDKSLFDIDRDLRSRSPRGKERETMKTEALALVAERFYRRADQYELTIARLPESENTHRFAEVEKQLDEIDGRLCEIRKSLDTEELPESEYDKLNKEAKSLIARRCDLESERRKLVIQLSPIIRKLNRFAAFYRKIGGNFLRMTKIRRQLDKDGLAEKKRLPLRSEEYRLIGEFDQFEPKIYGLIGELSPNDRIRKKIAKDTEWIAGICSRLIDETDWFESLDGSEQEIFREQIEEKRGRSAVDIRRIFADFVSLCNRRRTTRRKSRRCRGSSPSAHRDAKLESVITRLKEIDRQLAEQNLSDDDLDRLSAEKFFLSEEMYRLDDDDPHWSADSTIQFDNISARLKDAQGRNTETKDLIAGLKETLEGGFFRNEERSALKIEGILLTAELFKTEGMICRLSRKFKISEENDKSLKRLAETDRRFYAVCRRLAKIKRRLDGNDLSENERYLFLFEWRQLLVEVDRLESARNRLLLDRNADDAVASRLMENRQWHTTINTLIDRLRPRLRKIERKLSEKNVSEEKRGRLEREVMRLITEKRKLESEQFVFMSEQHPDVRNLKLFAEIDLSLPEKKERLAEIRRLLAKIRVRMAEIDRRMDVSLNREILNFWIIKEVFFHEGKNIQLQKFMRLKTEYDRLNAE